MSCRSYTEGNGGGSVTRATVADQQMEEVRIKGGQNQTSKGNKTKRCLRNNPMETDAENEPKAENKIKKGRRNRSADKLKRATCKKNKEAKCKRVLKNDKNGQKGNKRSDFKKKRITVKKIIKNIEKKTEAKMIKKNKNIKNDKNKKGPKYINNKGKNNANKMAGTQKKRAPVKKIKNKGKSSNKKATAAKKRDALKACVRNKCRPEITKDEEITIEKENIEKEASNSNKCKMDHDTNSESQNHEQSYFKTTYKEFDEKFKDFCARPSDGKNRLEKVHVMKTDMTGSNFFSITLEAKPLNELQMVTSNVKVGQMNPDGTGSETLVNRVCYINNSATASSTITNSASEINAANNLHPAIEAPSNEMLVNTVACSTYTMMADIVSSSNIESIIFDNETPTTGGYCNFLEKKP